jgi:hypothetical protein
MGEDEYFSFGDASSPSINLIYISRTPAAPAAAPPPEAPPLEPAREQGAQASSPPESPPSEAAEQNGEADADAASEGDDAANADKVREVCLFIRSHFRRLLIFRLCLHVIKASPAKKKKTRRSKRKPKPKEEVRTEQQHLI